MDLRSTPVVFSVIAIAAATFFTLTAIALSLPFPCAISRGFFLFEKEKPTRVPSVRVLSLERPARLFVSSNDRGNARPFSAHNYFR
jgi:hypothetical protein